MDQNQKQLIQWPIEEIEELHENEVSFQNKTLEGGSLHEIQGITASQVSYDVLTSRSNFVLGLFVRTLVDLLFCRLM